MVSESSNASKKKQPLDFFVANRAAQPHAVNVVDRNEHGGLIGHHSKMIKTAGRAEDSFGFDALNDAESVIWVNDLVADLECHASPTSVRCMGWDCTR